MEWRCSLPKATTQRRRGQRTPVQKIAVTNCYQFDHQGQRPVGNVGPLGPRHGSRVTNRSQTHGECRCACDRLVTLDPCRAARAVPTGRRLCPLPLCDETRQQALLGSSACSALNGFRPANQATTLPRRAQAKSSRAVQNRIGTDLIAAAHRRNRWRMLCYVDGNMPRAHRVLAAFAIALNVMARVAVAGPATPAPPLPPPTGTVVNVSTVSQLQNAVAAIASNTTIVIAAGTYNLTTRSTSMGRSPTSASAARRTIVRMSCSSARA